MATESENTPAAEILTSEEKAALATDASNIPTNKDSLDIKPVDFIHTQNKAYNQFSGLAALNEEFCIKVTERISRFLRQKFSITALEPHLITYPEIIESAKLPISINLIALTEQKNSMLICFNGELLYWVLTLLFGGAYNADDQPYKQFGKTEERIVGKLIEVIMEAFQEAWSEAGTFNYDITKLMLHPIANNLIAPQGELVSCGYILKIDELQLPFQLCFEKEMFNTLNMEIKFGSQRLQQEGQAWLHKLRDSVIDSTVTLAAVFPKIKLSLKDLMRLKVGDVIMMDDPNIVYVTIQGVSFFSGRAASSSGTRVIEVTDKIKY